MKRIGWIGAALTVALGLGLSGVAMLSNVDGSEPKEKKAMVPEISETVSGKVQAILKNDHGEVDGLSLEDGVTVHFPPHTGVSVSRIVVAGDRIEVRGHKHTRPKGEVVLEAERIVNGDISLDIERPQPPRKPKHGPGHEHDKPMNAAGAVQAFVSGKVQEILKNDHGDVDGLSLEDGVTIHFPPHTGVSVTRMVVVGDRIEVRGHKHTRPKGDVVLEAERIVNGDESLDIERPQPPRRPKHGPGHEHDKPMNATGTVQAFVSNRHGDVDGLRLSDGTEVKLPPHLGDELQALTKIGEKVRIEGRRHETPEGDVHLHADRIVATASGRALERDEPPKMATRSSTARTATSGRSLERDEPHKGRAAPPHEEVLQELRELRRLIESQQKSR